MLSSIRFRLRRSLCCIRHLKNDYGPRIDKRTFSTEMQFSNSMTTKVVPQNPSDKITQQQLFKQLVKSRPYSELILVIKSYIMSGHMDQAESLLAMVKLVHMSDFNSKEDPSLLNMLLQAYFERDEPRKAFEHLIALSGSRNSLTFALLLKYYLKKGQLEKCKSVIREMQMSGLLLGPELWQHYLDTKAISKSEWHQLKQVTGVLLEEGDDCSLVEIPSDIIDANTHREANEQLVSSAKIDEITSTKSSSNGIKYVKMSLQSLRDFGKENIDKYQLQEHLERDCLESACEQMQEEISKFLELSKSPNMSNIRRILCEWHMVLTKHYKAMIEDASNFSSSSPAPPSSSSGVLYSALLSSVPSEKISIIAMQELTRLSSLDVKLGGVPVTRLAMNIAENLEREIFAQQICKKEFLSYIRLNAKQRNDLLHSRRAFARFMDKTRKVLDDNIEARQAGWIPAWTPSIKAEVGVFVINEAVKMLKFAPDRNDDEYTDAFEHQIVFSDKKRHGIIKMHPVLFELLSKDSVFNGAEPWSMPMIVSPEPWTSYNQGGYLTQRNLCVRLKDDPVHLSVLHDANANGKMDQILHGLNILGQTTWLINEPILKVAIAEWNSGINVATHERPPLERKYEFKPADSFADRKDYAKYISDWSAYMQEKEKCHSTMCDTNYKLEIARQFVGIPFYLPHSVDFRGRAYPIPPHLSHVGSDLSRGLLKFAQGFPLGERGLFWLKVQLANMYGYDKYSLEDRAAFVDKHLDAVLDSARNPLGEKSWWREADEPWQCLAACIELEQALASPDPTKFLSHFPVQQDGSCNGLQHYAALGRDVQGAQKVNLSPSSSPQDIYAAVANLVIKKIDRDCEAGHSLALKLKGKINRKIIKQPVMTNVYGVTPFGARAQIQERLKEFNVVPKENYIEARKYLCDEVFSSLRTLFVKARLIQDWLTTASTEISRALPVDVAVKFGYKPETEVSSIIQGEKYRTPSPLSDIESDASLRYPQTPVSWNTPLGFRVVQPYLKTRSIHLKTVMQTVSLRASNQFDPVDVNKQVSAFPPNFIHSLDATHMFMTAMACFEAGITFASVHDCFWTHPSMVDGMNRHIREQFVALYSQPILERLREDLLQNYGTYKIPIKVPIDSVAPLPDDAKPTEASEKIDEAGRKTAFVSRWRHIHLPPIPEKGDFDITQVLGSQYFFS